MYSKKETVNSINVIRTSDTLTNLLREKYGTDWDMMIAGVRANMIKDSAIGFIMKLAPCCYKIGCQVYMKNCVREFNDNSYGNTDGLIGAIDLTELMNMSEEIFGSGNSYSTYMSDISDLPLATYEESLEVALFFQEKYK